MTDYMITARAIEDGKFSPEPGPARYLRLAGNVKTPKPDHQVRSAREWFKDVRDKADGQPRGASVSAAGDVLFYLHGFNVTQKLALARQRQLEQNLRAEGWQGIVVGFDWPSDNSVLNYIEDRSDGAEVADQLVTKGLKQLAITPPEECRTNIHILAHSAGAYVTITAFSRAMRFERIFKADWRIGQVALVSGDISSSSLRDGHDRSAPMFSRVMRLTNYQNPFDNVLAVSNAKRLGTSPRAGRVGLPKNAHPKAVNVNCGRFFSQMNPGDLTHDPGGNIPHSWYTASRVFCRDLAMTLEGAIDRAAIPTRDPSGGDLHLQDQPRPAHQDAWKMLPPIY